MARTVKGAAGPGSSASAANTALTCVSARTFSKASTPPESRPVASCPSTVRAARCQPVSARTVNDAPPPLGTRTAPAGEIMPLPSALADTSCTGTGEGAGSPSASLLKRTLTWASSARLSTVKQYALCGSTALRDRSVGATTACAGTGWPFTSTASRPKPGSGYA